MPAPTSVLPILILSRCGFLKKTLLKETFPLAHVEDDDCSNLQLLIEFSRLLESGDVLSGFLPSVCGRSRNVQV